VRAPGWAPSITRCCPSRRSGPQHPLHGVAFIGEANAESESIITEIGKVKTPGPLADHRTADGRALKAVFAETFQPGFA
jgi:hypothetical protein